MTVFVAVDIGCIECGEDSALLGVFLSKNVAQEVLDEALKAQAEDWHGQHVFKLFETKVIE